MTGRVYVVGSLNEDLVLTVDHIAAPGETVLARAAARGSGGKGANQAVAAARAGAAAHLVGCVGTDDAGSRLLAGLHAEAVDTAGVLAVPGPSGLAVVSVAEDGENAIVVVDGANAHCTADVVAQGLSGLSAGDVVVAQGEVSAEAVEAAGGAASAASATFVLNLAPPVEVQPDRARVGLLVVNHHEALVVARRTGCPGEDVETVAAHLASLFGAGVVVTLGAEGACVADADGVRRVAPVPAERVVDTTGAGDAFVGALAAALAQGERLSVSVAWGMAAGAIAVQERGAQGGVATPDRIRALLGGSRPVS